MNRIQKRQLERRDPEAYEKMMAEAPSTALPPVYQADIKIHLPASKMWGRKDAVNKKRTIQGYSPDLLWGSVVAGVTDMLGMGEDSRYVMGLLLNRINAMPQEVRLAFLQGIVEGHGMHITPRDGGIDVEVLPGTFQPIELTPDGGIVHKTPSGLILPGGNQPLSIVSSVE